jgi:ATP/ADP translocase
VETYYYGIAFSSLFLLFGFLIFAISLILLQSKFYFEELSRMLQDPRKLRTTNAAEETGDKQEMIQED